MLTENNEEDSLNDEQVSKFMAFTGSNDPSRATSYLEMSGGDIQTAVALYLEHQTNNRIRNTGNSANNDTYNNNTADEVSSTAPIGDISDGEIRAPDATRTMRLMDFDEGSSLGNPMAELMPGGAGGISEAMMRSVMTATASGANRGNVSVEGLMDNAFAVDRESSFRDVINRAVAGEAEGGDVFSSSFVRASGGERGGVRENDENVDRIGGVKDEDCDDSEVEDMITSYTNTSSRNGGSTEQQRRSRRLGEMFEAPIHLIYNRGGFQGARNVAKDARRWLLVNLQSDSDFACHALNRDVWRDELVENLVREGFIFWQSSNVAPDGQTYAQRYNVASYPHIAIIDPRTGRQMWKKEGWTAENPLTAQMFAERAADFCSHHSFDKEPIAPRVGGLGAASLRRDAGTSSVGASSPFASCDTEMEKMTEEQQLQAAIRASMNTSGGNKPYIEKDDNDKKIDSYVIDADDDSVNDNEDVLFLEPPHSHDKKVPARLLTTQKEETKKETRPYNFQEDITSIDVGEEPIDAEGVAKIMIRMPDGKRFVRKFLLTDAVKIIYAFVAQSNDDAKGGKIFECKVGFPPKDLCTYVNDTIKSVGLGGNTVTVMWK